MLIHGRGVQPQIDAAHGDVGRSIKQLQHVLVAGDAERDAGRAGGLGHVAQRVRQLGRRAARRAERQRQVRAAHDERVDAVDRRDRRGRADARGRLDLDLALDGRRFR